MGKMNSNKVVFYYCLKTGLEPHMVGGFLSVMGSESVGAARSNLQRSALSLWLLICYHGNGI